MKKIISLFVAFISAITLISNIAFASFHDVKDSAQMQAVQWLQDIGAVQGYSDGTFRPGNSVTRAEFLKMLYEATGMHGPTITKLPFTDIDEKAWYINYVREAYADHIIDGYSDGTFKPNNTINVAEASKIVANAYFDVDALYNNGKNLYKCSGITLSDTNVWYAKYIGVLDSLCLMPQDTLTDYPYGFALDMNMTRGAMAVILYKSKASHDNGNVKYTEGLTPKSKSNTEDTRIIEIKDFSFSPSTLSVKGVVIAGVNPKVTWINRDSVSHTVTVDSGTGPNSSILKPGDTYTYTFTKVGTFNYHCNIHPSMKGTVTVTE